MTKLLSIWIMLIASLTAAQEWSWPGYPDEGALGRYLLAKGYTMAQLEAMTFDEWREQHNKTQNANQGKYITKHTPGWARGFRCGDPGCVMCYGRTTRVAAWDKSLRQVASWDNLQPSEPQEQAPTPMKVVEEIMKLLNVSHHDYFVDLGCGDGRVIMLAARKYAARCVGVEIDPKKAAEATKLMKPFKEHSIVLNQDVLALEDLSRATIVYMYLYVDLMEQLKPQLSTLTPGARVVTYLHQIPGVQPDKHYRVTDEKGRKRSVFIYVAGKDKFK